MALERAGKHSEGKEEKKIDASDWRVLSTKRALGHTGVLNCCCQTHSEGPKNTQFTHRNGRMNLQNLYNYNRSKTLLLGRILEPRRT